MPLDFDPGVHDTGGSRYTAADFCEEEGTDETPVKKQKTGVADKHGKGKVVVETGAAAGGAAKRQLDWDWERERHQERMQEQERERQREREREREQERQRQWEWEQRREREEERRERERQREREPQKQQMPETCRATKGQHKIDTHQQNGQLVCQPPPNSPH